MLSAAVRAAGDLDRQALAPVGQRRGQRVGHAPRLRHGKAAGVRAGATDHVGDREGAGPCQSGGGERRMERSEVRAADEAQQRVLLDGRAQLALGAELLGDVRQGVELPRRQISERDADRDRRQLGVALRTHVGAHELLEAGVRRAAARRWDRTERTGRPGETGLGGTDARSSWYCRRNSSAPSFSTTNLSRARWRCCRSPVRLKRRTTASQMSTTSSAGAKSWARIPVRRNVDSPPATVTRNPGRPLRSRARNPMSLNEAPTQSNPQHPPKAILNFRGNDDESGPRSRWRVTASA